MQTITKAHRALENADEALRHAEHTGAPAEVLEDLAADVKDAEAAYFDAAVRF